MKLHDFIAAAKPDDRCKSTLPFLRAAEVVLAVEGRSMPLPSTVPLPVTVDAILMLR